jgi:biotin carboxylase
MANTERCVHIVFTYEFDHHSSVYELLRLQIPASNHSDGSPVRASSPQAMKDELKEYKLTMTGHAIECRLCAEDPCNDLLPARCSPLCDHAVVL